MDIKKILAIATLCASAAFGGDWALVANPALGVASISKSDLKRVYTGKKGQIGSAKAVPFVLPETNPAMVAFLSDVLGMSPADFKKFWVDAQIKGEGTAPATQKTSAAAVAVVGEIPGGLAIVEKSAVTAAVKEVDVK